MLLIYLLFLAGLISLGIVVAPVVAEEISAFSASLPDAYARLSSTLAESRRGGERGGYRPRGACSARRAHQDAAQDIGGAGEDALIWRVASSSPPSAPSVDDDRYNTDEHHDETTAGDMASITRTRAQGQRS